MTDSLRDKIAAVLGDELFKRGAYTEYGTDDEPGQWERVDGHINITALADAVIRELGLTPEFGCGTSDLRHGCRCSHRYVTEWETDEPR